MLFSIFILMNSKVLDSTGNGLKTTEAPCVTPFKATPCTLQFRNIASK
jgi:hypothetical protein